MPGRSRTQRNRTRRNRTRRNRTQRNRSRRNLHKTMRRKKNIKTNKFRNKRIVKTKRIKGGGVGFRRTPGAVKSARKETWKSGYDDYIDPPGFPARYEPDGRYYTEKDAQNRAKFLKLLWQSRGDRGDPGWWLREAIEGKVPNKLYTYINDMCRELSYEKDKIIALSEMMVDWWEFTELSRKEAKGRASEFDSEYLDFYFRFLTGRDVGMTDIEIEDHIEAQYNLPAGEEPPPRSSYRY